ncbi:MAG: methyltransferase domain-containing protein, partial [Candidatus Thorarchaeota archaeon]
MTADTSSQEVTKIGSYFSNISHVFVEEYNKNGLKKHTKIFLDYFSNIGINGLTVLELGCGIGGLLFHMLDMGAKEVYGIDLSDTMVKNAQNLSKSLGFEAKTTFVKGDFTSDAKKLLSIERADIVIADRVMCCSPVPLEILDRMISYDPKYLLIVQPRKNILYRALFRLRVKLRQLRLKVKSHNVQIPYMGIKEYDKRCEDSGFKRVLQKFRYSWEIIV